jgi:hypothetical protein
MHKKETFYLALQKEISSYACVFVCAAIILDFNKVSKNIQKSLDFTLFTLFENFTVPRKL